jgi:BirA family biotin operon repressor/biotin-[acetyl-CoA-carboxylase] ligase
MSADLRALALRLARPEHASGNALAAEFGITRAAIWKRIERLRALGLSIVSEPGRGYRLGAPIDWLEPARIRRQLSRPARALLGLLEVHFELDSTSSEWLRRAPQLPQGSVCLAESQSAGRGRRGRAWQSPLGSGLYLSLLWRFDGGLSALPGLSLAIAVAVRRALLTLGLSGVALKWPNDLWFERRKLGGILIEASGESAGPCTVIVGVGLNLILPAATAELIGQPCTDLRVLARACNTRNPDRNALAAALIEALLPALAEFGREGLAPFLREWRAADALAGHEVLLESGGSRSKARALGVDAIGRLRVAADGRERLVASAEVSIRPAR